jgi:hypothetical protein
VSSAEDRNGGEVEKSIQKQISRLAYGSLEMTSSTLFYRTLSSQRKYHFNRQTKSCNKKSEAGKNLPR